MSSPREAVACEFCPARPTFRSAGEWTEHLRARHSTVEGGSNVCKFGPHGVCASLPIDGVSTSDYEAHVRRIHLPSHMSLGHSLKPSSSSSSLGGQAPPALLQDLERRGVPPRLALQNLSSVLSDPRKSRREVAVFFTRDHGSDFLPATSFPPRPGVKPVTPKHFIPYLSNIGRKQKRHVKDERRLAERSGRGGALVGGGGDESDGGASASLALYHRLLPELPSIPPVFLSPSFSLQDPTTFAQVFLAAAYPEDANPFAGDESVSASASASDNPFQEELDEEERQRSLRLRPSAEVETELGGFLDAVETRIGLQIAARSGAFFKAMACHDELQGHLAQTKAAVGQLRSRIGEMDRVLVQRSARIAALHRAQKARKEFLARLELMRTVAETQASVQVLLNQYDFLAALDVIGTTQAVLREQLGGVFAFRHLGLQLSELENVIGRMLKEEFIRLVQTELGGEENSGSGGSGEDVSGQLSSLLLGFLRLREFRFVPVLREETVSGIKSLLRDAVRGELDSEARASEEMRRLNWSEWMSLMGRLSRLLWAFGRRLGGLLQAGEGLLESAAGHAPAPSPEMSGLCLEEADYAELSHGLGGVRAAAASAAQELLLRLLSLRGREGGFDRLRLEQVQELLAFCRSFGEGMESALGSSFSSAASSSAGGRQSSLLMNGAQGQLNGWVDVWARARKEKLTAILDSEAWRAAEVPALFQAILDGVEATGRLRDVAQGPPGAVEALLWRGERWLVVSTAAMLLRMCCEYAGLAEEVPSLAGDLLPRLADLLKTFNSRTCQLILGAGAMHTMGLKSISLRHLALAWRSLQLIASILPILREELTPLLSPTQMKANLPRHLAQVGKDLDDHIAELHNKIIAVSESYLRSRLGKWSLEGAAEAPTPAMQKVVRSIQSAYEQIGGALPPVPVQKLMLRIHALFKELWRERLLDAGISPSDSRRYALVCSDWGFYLEGLRQIPPLAALDDSLTSVYAGR